jgi:hypothetical protein
MKKNIRKHHFAEMLNGRWSCIATTEEVKTCLHFLPTQAYLQNNLKAGWRSQCRNEPYFIRGTCKDPELNPTKNPFNK